MVISVDGNKWHDTAILLRGNDVVAEFAPRRKLMREVSRVHLHHALVAPS